LEACIFTLNGDDAKFFATPSILTRESGIGTIIKAKVYFSNPCNWEILEDIGNELDATEDEVSKYTDNNNGVVDFLYIPRVLKKLEEMKYDSYLDLDVLLEKHIPIIIVWHPKQIKIVEIYKIND